MSELVKALAAALPKVEGASKDKTNPAFRSKYADLGNVIDAIRPVMENGIWFRQASVECAGGACVETFYIHTSGEEKSAGQCFIPANKQDAHGYGSAMSYARRYGLLAAFGIAPEDDDGNAATTHSKAQAASKAPAKPVIEPPCSDVDVTRITELAEAAGVSLDVIKESYLVDDIAKLNATQALKTINNLKKRIDDKAKETV